MKKIWVFNVIISIIIIMIGIIWVDKDDISKRYTNYTVWKEVGTAGYLGLDIYQTIKSVIPKDNEKQLLEVEKFQKSHEIEAYSFLKKKKIENVILIQLEGVDSIAIDMQKDNTYIMKNLHSIKERGIWFENVFDQTGSGRTSDGEFLALTSLLPVNGESMYTQYNLGNIISLPKIMNNLGNLTIALHGNEAAFWNRDQAHQSLGYEKGIYYEQVDGEIEDKYNGWGLSDRTIMRKTFKMIKETNQPVFTHTILLTGHHPYTAVNDMDLDLPYREPTSLIENYINCLFYTDLVMGEFFDNLQKDGILDKSLVLIFSDHDSGITEEVYNYCGINYNGEDINCDKIPMILYDGINSYKEKEIMGQADILPLILSYLDIELPQSIMGANYINGEKVVYRQNGLIGENKVLEENIYDMDTITKVIVNVGDVTKDE